MVSAEALKREVRTEIVVLEIPRLRMRCGT